METRSATEIASSLPGLVSASLDEYMASLVEEAAGGAWIIPGDFHEEALEALEAEVKGRLARITVDREGVAPRNVRTVITILDIPPCELRRETVGETETGVPLIRIGAEWFSTAWPTLPIAHEHWGL